MSSHEALSKTVHILFTDDEKASFSSAVKKAEDGEALFCEEMIDVAIDIPSRDLHGVSSECLSRQTEEAQHLKARLLETLSRKMPHLIEKRHRGYNRHEPDTADIQRIQEKVRAVQGTTVPERLLAPAHHFLDTLLLLQQSHHPAANEIDPYAFDLMYAISDALDAVTAAEKVEHLEWDAQVAATADAYRHNLIAALPQELTQPQQAEELLLSASNASCVEYQRFAQLKQSLMAETRLTRQRLAEYLQQQANVIQSNARDARLFAMKMLLRQGDRVTLGSAEQLADWMQEYLVFAYPMPGVDGALQGNPQVSERKAGEDHEPDDIRLVRHILHIGKMFGSLAARLKQVQKRVAPDDEKKAADKLWHRAGCRVRNLTQLAKQAGAGPHNILTRVSAREKPLRQPPSSETLNRVVRDSALLLLDAIQQTERRIKQIPAAAGRVADAVEQYLQMTESRAGDEVLPALNHLLTQEVEAEATRWHSVAHHAQQQLEALIDPLAKRTKDEWADLFRSAQFEALRDAGRGEGIEKLDKILRQTAGRLSQLALQIQRAVVRLAKLGHSGRIELNHHIAQWLVALMRMKAGVKNSVVEITGRALGSFSHSGMLVRGISDWATALRQEYLRDVHPQNKTEAAILFDRTVLELINDSRSQLAKKADPQAEGFISRLKLALQLAAEDTTAYPPTPEAILAGSRSLPEDLQRWAESKVIGGALSAILREGFSLTIGPCSLPVRVVLREGQTGVNSSLRDRIINKALSPIAFRLTMSLSPTRDISVAAAPLYKQQGEITKQIVSLPQALAWKAGFVGTGAGVNTALRRCIEQALVREVENFMAEAAIQGELAAKPAAPFAETDENLPPRRKKRAAGYPQEPSAKDFDLAPERETAPDLQHESEVKEEPGNKGATAALLSDVRGWNVRGAYNLALTGVPREGGIYHADDGHLYIYLAGRFWPCKKLSADLYGVFVSAWGMKKVVIISDVNGHWDYADQTDVEKFNAFLAIQKNITESNLESAAKKRIDASLSADNFISWGDLIKRIINIINREFYNLYLHPENEKLIAIMMLRKMILDTQSVADGILKGRAYESTNLFWNQQLLSLYWEAFNVDITDISILATARYARILADDALAKYNKLNKKFFEKEKKRLAKINASIADLKNKIWEAENNPREYISASLAMAFYVRYSQDFTTELKKKEGERSVVQSIVNRVQKKRDSYRQLIQAYKEKYQRYEEGMALGDKAFTQRLKMQHDTSDIITAAKEAVAELALKEVKLRQSLRFGDGEWDSEQIDTLRIARATIRTILVQQQTYVDLVETLETINITIPAARESYADIVWANNVTDEIYPKIFAGEENAAARDLLPAMLHWLQKNKKSVSHLKNLRAQEIIDTYAKSRHELNPLMIEKDIPEGYTSLSAMLGREYFSSKWYYNQQFIEYKRRYSSYEASERVKELLIVSGLSVDEITAPVKKSIRLDVRKKNNVKNVHAGELLFIQLKDNNWVFFSIFPKATFSRRFTEAQMHSNPWLNAIANLVPQRVHSHGLESVFTEAFFKKQFGHANEKIYWDGTRRAAKEKEAFINNILYKNEGETEYPNPFAHAHFGGTEYSVYKHEEQLHHSLVVTLNISMKNALDRSANKLKSDLYKPSALHRIACIFIPFYSDIYGSVTDGEYQPDGFALIADIFAVVCVAAQLGAKIGALINNSKGIATIAREGVARGLTGKSLYKYMIREMGEQGVINAIELGKISASAIFDLVDALMLRDLSSYIMSKIRADMIFHNIVPGKSAAATVGKEFIRLDVTLKDMHKQTLRGGEVYVSISPKTRLRVYYIETANGIAEVRWSPTTKAWRTVDPKDPSNPGQIMHPEKNKWVVTSVAKGTSIQPEMGIQRLRTNLPDEKIPFNIQHAKETEGVDAQALLEELYRRNSTKLAMTNPAERSKYVMASVGNYMIEKGFENIRYRGMAVFVDSVDQMPANHFVVIGAKNNRDYVFDLSAGAFSRKYDEFNGPVILPEELWAQKYANINGTSLIKYADYKSRVKADEIFGAYSEYTHHGPQAVIPNAKVLRRPEWYYPDSVAADNSAEVVTTAALWHGAGNELMSSVRRSQRRTVTTDNAADYAVDLLENSELLNKETANLLRQCIKHVEEGGRAITEATGLLDTPRLITSQDDLLCVDKGEMLFFFRTNAAVQATSTHPVHVMVSVGNGRFAGINNNTLDQALSNDPRILLAEQLGDFTGTQAKRNADGEKMQIFAARPTGLLLADKPALRDLASTLPADTDSISGLTDLLAQCGKLSPEQAQGLARALQPVINNPAPVYGQMGAIEDVLTSPVRIKTEAEMLAVPQGHLVTFMRMGKSNAGHVMYSLGNGEFIIINPAKLDASLADKSTIIHARDIPAEVWRYNVISAGGIALKKMRVSALLGEGGTFSVEGSTLSIKAMGGPGAVNSMDAQELADTIRGLARSENFAVDLSRISEIKFYSHFGAFGRLPVGKALAWLLNKKVTAYPVFYSPKLQGKEALLSEAKSFLPEDLSADELTLLANQQSRSHEFWQHTRSLFGDKGATESVEMSSDLKELLLKVADYVRGKISIDDFLDGMPNFTNGLMIMKVGLNLLYNHEEIDFDGYVSLSCDVLGASRFGVELIIQFIDK
ncbi:hypothetical protein [Kosakonia cowanii]|uniref:hypothetical protein n=1 Tax=Kosakonia cowanii TaxID=208223 RepID=UPI0028A2C438|nr:hypothetical protein [Kosakonia cowanii]